MNTPTLNPRDEMILRVVGDAIRKEMDALRRQIDVRFESATGLTGDALMALSARLTAEFNSILDARAVKMKDTVTLELRNDLEALEERIADTLQSEFEGVESRLNELTSERFEASLMDIERRAILAVQAAIPAPRDGRDGQHGRDGKDAVGTAGKDGRDGEFSAPHEFKTIACRGELIQHRGGLWYALTDTEHPPAISPAWRLLCNGIAGVTMQQTGPRELGITLELSDGTGAGEVIRVPGNDYKGAWTEPRDYLAGDTVTKDGGLFIAVRDTNARPGEANSGWQLAVKRGSDGKDGHSFDWCGDYQAGKRHKRGDVVRAPTGLFVAIKGTTAAPPFHADRSDDWALILRTTPGPDYGATQ